MADSFLSSPGGPGSGGEEREFLNFVKRRARLIVLCLIVVPLLSVALAVVYLLFTPSTYTATAIVEVPEHGQRLIGTEDKEGTDLRSEEILKTTEQNLQRMSIFSRVAARKDITEDPGLRKSLDTPIESLRPGELAAKLKDWTRVSHRRRTRLINVAVDHHDREFAAKLANTLVEEFIRERVERQSGSSSSTFDFLLNEAERVRERLQASEDRLLNVQEFQDALVLKEKIEVKEDEVLQLSQRYRAKHPSLIQARGSLAALNEQLRLELLKSHRLIAGADSPEGSPAAAVADIGDQQLDAELKILEARFNVLSREIGADRALYESIVGRMKETGVAKELDSVPVTIAEMAFPPLEPSSPNKIQTLGFSVFLGGGLGVTLVWLLCGLDGSIGSVREVERLLRIPVIGAVPEDRHLARSSWAKAGGSRPLSEMKAHFENRQSAGESEFTPSQRSGRKGEPLVILSDPGNPVAEALRTARAGLTAKGSIDEPKSFLVTSALPSEGKSVVAANLAASFAVEEGRKTLLIDANLRAPAVDTLFGAEAGSGGIAGAFSGHGDKKPGANVTASGFRKLDLLLVGKNRLHSGEILSASSVPKALVELLKEYERIVIDGSHVTSVADALLLAPHVQSTILVIRAGKTPKGAIVRARDMLEGVESKPDGLVLNRLPG